MERWVPLICKEGDQCSSARRERLISVDLFLFLLSIWVILHKYTCSPHDLCKDLLYTWWACKPLFNTVCLVREMTITCIYNIWTHILHDGFSAYINYVTLHFFHIYFPDIYQNSYHFLQKCHRLQCWHKLLKALLDRYIDRRGTFHPARKSHPKMKKA